MNKSDTIAKFSRAIHNVGFQLKKYSPEIMTVAGVVGMVASTVMACKATTKASEIIDETKTSVSMIHDLVADQAVPESEYSEEDSKRDLVIVYSKAAMKFAKLYGPSLIIAGLSASSILSSTNILRKRNIAIGTAYTALDRSFRTYRDRVIEKFGEDFDKELKYGTTTKVIEETTVDENGNEKTETKTVKIADPNNYSIYARFYDDGCAGWTKNPEYNLIFLKQQQNWANEKLKANGRLFLNEVYEMLGIPKTVIGQRVGWVYDENNPVGDNFVDFGIYDLYNEKARDFVNGYERTILLDFNVDGDILYSL